MSARRTDAGGRAGEGTGPDRDVGGRQKPCVPTRDTWEATNRSADWTLSSLTALGRIDPAPRVASHSISGVGLRLDPMCEVQSIRILAVVISSS